MHFIIFF